MLSGCVTNPVAEWGTDGLTVNVDEGAGTAVILNNLGDSTGERETVNLVGCDRSHIIPEVEGNISETSYKEKVHIDGWLTASKSFPEGVEVAFGDITDKKAVVWEYNRDTPYAPSPLLYGDKLYFLKRNNGILSCFNASTGEAY